MITKKPTRPKVSAEGRRRHIWTIEVREADGDADIQTFLDTYARVLLAELAAQRRAEAAREESV